MSLLYCESHISSQHKWPCCLRCHVASDTLTVVFLLNCIARVIAVASASGRVVPVLRKQVILLQLCCYCIARVIAVAGRREWPCCLRCHGTSSNLAVVVLLCCYWVISEASPSGSVMWDVMVRVIICSSRGDTSSDHLVVALSYSMSNISSQREWRCCWDSNLIIH